MTAHDDPTDSVVSVEALLSRARDQDGIDQLWSLVVASLALRARQAPPEPLDRVDGQLRAHLEAYTRGHATPIPPALIDTLADLNVGVGLGQLRGPVESGPLALHCNRQCEGHRTPRAESRI